MKEVWSSPVSFLASVARLPKSGLPVTIDADASAREFLAKEHGLLAVASFRADMLVTPWKRNGIKVAGRVDAEITQACIVSLEPIESRVGEEFSQIFLPEDSKLGREGFHTGGEVLLDAEGPDAPDTFAGDTIDVGALAEEFFALAIDPYPRKAGAGLPPPPSDAEALPATTGTLGDKLRALTRKD